MCQVKLLFCLCSVDMSGVEDQAVRAKFSSAVEQLMSLCNEEDESNEGEGGDEYSKCAKREEEQEPLILHAPSTLPSVVSCHIERSENVLNSAVTNSTAGEGPQPEPLASVIDNETEQNSATLVHELDVDDDAEPHISEDDNDDERENDEVGVGDYQTASEVSNTADVHSYMFARVMDVSTTEMLPDQYMSAAVSEPASDSASTSGSYWQAQALPDAAAGLSGSFGTIVDHSLDGSSDEPTAAVNGLQSPESDDGYCAAELFTDTNTA